MTVKTQVRLSLYERGIVEALTAGYSYSAGEARQLVVSYIEVVRKLGGYDNSVHYAQLLDRANRKEFTPSQWLDHIRTIERGELRDSGIGEEEREYLQTK